MKKNVYYIHTLLTFNLIIFTILSGLVLTSTYVSAENNEVIDTMELTVPVACTMGGVGNNSHNATLNPGTYSGASGSEYENGIGKTALTAICNDDNGFSIYAIGYTGNEYGATNLIGENTAGAIATKAYASGDTASNWSMKLTKVDNPSTGDPVTYNPENFTITTNYDNWIAVPATYTRVAQYKANTGSSTTDTTLGAKLETTYAAYIASSQAADTYVGQVKYTMVHPYNEEPSLFPQTATSGCINYFPNGSNIEGTMGCQPISSSDSTATLLASNYSRSGYGFAGWSDSFDYATNTNAKLYGPQEDITFTAGQYTGNNNGLSLYAIWIKSAGSLQDTDKVTALCGTNGIGGSLTIAPTDGTANLDSVTALTDQRDNQTYAIARLADGNCWMIENLRLENTNSDNSTGLLAQGYGTSTTYGNFSGLPIASSGWDNSATANNIYSTNGANNTIRISTSNASYRFPRYSHVNTYSRATNPTANTEKMYSYGNYYTWAAAIADTTAHSTDNQSVANTSLCPTGWHLPTGGLAYTSSASSGVNVTGNTSTFREFYNLSYKTMNQVKTAYQDTSNSGKSYYSSRTTNTIGNTADKAFRSFPNNFVRSGNSSSANYRDLYGYYWSSTASSTVSSYTFVLGPSVVYPGTYNISKFNGNTIRCIASS